LLIIKILFLLLDFAFAYFLISFIYKTRWFKLAILFPLRDFLTRESYGISKARREYKRVSRKMDRFNEKGYKKAIIRLDESLSKVLEGLVPSFQMNTFEERLSQLAEGTLDNVNEIQEAHKVYLEIKKNSGYELEIEQGKLILEEYKDAFRELEII